MDILDIKRALVAGVATYVSPEEFMTNYRVMIGSHLDELTYDSNTLELFKYPGETYLFKIENTFFEIHKEGRHYTSWFAPFTLGGVDLEALKLCIELGIDMVFHEKHREKLGYTHLETYLKFDSYIYNYKDIMDNFNRAGRNNTRRKINKLRNLYDVILVKANDVNGVLSKAISEIEEHWFTVTKESDPHFDFNLNQFVKFHKPSTAFDNTFLLMYKNKETGNYDGYSCTEIMNDRGLEYIRKSSIGSSHYEYMTIIQLEVLKEHFGIEKLDFGAARFLYGKAKTDRLNKGLYETKSSLPHELSWVHTSGYNTAKFYSVDISSSNELF